MIIQNINGVVYLYAEGSNKITNIERNFFTDIICLGKNANISNYQEVPREIWKHFVEDLPTDFDILQEKISDNNLMIVNLEELLLDTDFRLMCLEMGITP